MDFVDARTSEVGTARGGIVAESASLAHVFVINLDEDRARFHRFGESMRHFGIPFERWRATPGADLDARRFGRRPLAPGVFVTGFRQWSANEAACGVSHIRLLQHVVRQQIQWAIVMEDDGIVTRDFPLEIRSWELPADADIIMLNHRASVGAIRTAGSQFSYGDVVGGAGTEAYLVSLSGARKLLRVLYPFMNPLDFQMYAHFESIQRGDVAPYHWTLPKNPRALGTFLKAYRVVPDLVMHLGTDSSIGGQRHPRAHFYCKLLLGMDFGAEGVSPVTCRQWMVPGAETTLRPLSCRQWIPAASCREWVGQQAATRSAW